MIEVIVGTEALLNLQLFDGATDRFPVAYVRDSAGLLVFTISLVHKGMGLCENVFIPSTAEYYTSTFIVYSDALHTVEDTYYEYSEDIYMAVTNEIPTPQEIADAVWDEPMLSHSLAGSFGIHFQVIRQFSEVTAYELTTGVDSLANIMGNITNQGVLDRIEINQNELKIDQIIPAVNLARDVVIADVDQVKLLVQALANQLTLTDSHLTNEIVTNRNKIDQVMASINSLSNNTTVRLVVPEQMMKPLSGTTMYQYHLRLFDDLGNPEAPDSVPTIRIRDLNSGTDVINGAVMTQDGAKIGAYFYNYTISSSSLLHHFLVEVTVVELGVTRYIPAVTEITEYQSDLEAIQLQLNDVDTKVTINKNMLENPVYGLQAITNDIDAVDVHVADVANQVTGVSAQVTALPTLLATKTDVTDIINTVLTRSTLVDIQAALELVRQQIMGPDNRNNTNVYDKIDFTGVMQTSDPRLNYLDAAISSRGTLTAAQVWIYATRTLTNITIPIAEFKKVWDVLTSQMIVPSSIGEYILHMLDTNVSSRATFVQVQSLLSGVAQESSVQSAIARINQDITNGQICCSTLTNLLTAVKAKTDHIPANPATEQNIDSAETDIENLINNLELIINSIKTYTDRIPVDPAHESTVSGIPHNTLLANDSRLAYLDAFISSRATAVDISSLATHSDVSSSTASIIHEVNANETKIDALQLTVNQKPNQLYFDNKFFPLATEAHLSQVRNDILNAIPSGTLTAAQVWEYVTRSLTTPFPDISNLATKEDVVYHSYSSKFSTTYRAATSDQELIVWGEKDGQRVSSSSNCSVNIKSSDGASLWNASVSAPNTDGVYRFIHNISAGVDQNFYIVITMSIDSVVRTTQQAFFTVG
jgi:hypothetical protein